MDSLILGQSELGKAVFANKDFKKGERIIEFKGKPMKRRELPKLIAPEDDRYVQVGKDKYLGHSGNYDDFFNHSCDPNSGLKFDMDKVILVAIKDIKKGREITWDYSTTLEDDFWEIDCLCKSKNCRKRIRDFKYLPKDIQQKYIKLGVVPGFIIDGIKVKHEQPPIERFI